MRATRKVNRAEGRGSSDRRSALLHALERLLAKRRLESIAIADIATEAGVTRSNFYFYFPSKGAAVAELLRPVLEQLAGLATDWDAGPRSTTAERLRLAIAKTITFWRGYATLIVAMCDAAAIDAAARATRDHWIEDWGRRAATRVVADRQAGAAGDGIDASRLSWMLVGMTAHAMERDVREIMERGHGIPDLAEALAAIWARAIYDG